MPKKDHNLGHRISPCYYLEGLIASTHLNGCNRTVNVGTLCWIRVFYLFFYAKVLDDRNKGILAADYVSELLLTRGDALTKKQVKVLMSESNAAADGYFAYMSTLSSSALLHFVHRSQLKQVLENSTKVKAGHSKVLTLPFIYKSPKQHSFRAYNWFFTREAFVETSCIPNSTNLRQLDIWRGFLVAE